MDEIKRAQNIIKAYAEDPEGLTLEECATEGFSPGQCEVLVQALGKGAEGKITATDEFVLKSRHFSKEFIDALAGTDGNKALQQRGVWFAYNLNVARTNIEDAVPALIEALKYEFASVRQETAWALGEIKVANAVPALIEALKDESVDVRDKAAYSLRQIKDAIAVPALIEALKDEAWGVRRAAAYVLGEIKDANAVPALIETLKDEFAHVRSNVAGALGEIGHVAAIPPLQEMAKNDPDLYCREAAQEALEKLKGN